MLRIGILTIIALAASAAQGALTIPWYTVDGGGRMLTTGGTLELSGTVGQADANATVLSGGTFELRGGFWAGGAASLPGDCNGDGSVDRDDYIKFGECMTGPNMEMSPGCDCHDLDDDSDIDLHDFSITQRTFTGP